MKDQTYSGISDSINLIEEKIHNLNNIIINEQKTLDEITKDRERLQDKLNKDLIKKEQDIIVSDLGYIFGFSQYTTQTKILLMCL